MEEKVYVYCRISTPKQDIQRQIRNGKKLYPGGIVVEETYTGKTQERPKWVRLLRQIDKDIANGNKVKIVFDSVSRMSRDKEEGVKQYFELYEKGVELEFIKESMVNTVVFRQAISNSIAKVDDAIANVYIEATNRVLRMIAERQIEEAFKISEGEIKELSDRTKEGIITARLNGKKIGRPEGYRPQESNKARKCKKLIEEGSYKVVEVCKIVGCSKDSYYRWKRELEESKVK